ncbi:MAG TPA: acyl-CoA dehydrogenase family protein, partial [Polyangiaceae bacterium]
MNRLIDDELVSFLLHDVLDVASLTALPRFAAHSPEGFDMAVQSAARFAREVMAPTVRAMEADPPRFEDGRIRTHAALKDMYAQMVEQGFLTMARSEDVGGMQFPTTIALTVSAYLGAANMGAAGYLGLTHGAARLIESFGTAALKEAFMRPMYEGRFTGTMALTEPQAGSSLADVRTKATPEGDHYLIEGEKIFISGGDNTFAENIVHLTLARIDGAPPGIKGVSLFVVPAKRLEGGALVSNDVAPSGLFHKIGWKGLPSIALKYGDEGKCHGYLVGKPGDGLKHMFQMMNEARLNVGMAGVSNCSAAYQASLEYARARPQGRALTNRDATSPQIPITAHADVRRMLLAQKAIVEGGLSLLLQCGKYQDLAEAAEGETKQRAQKLLDLLTPIAKSFPAEKGFESNVLAIQVHGGYGYT